MERAVLTERQSSDCDVKCPMTFITKGNTVVGCGIQNMTCKHRIVSNEGRSCEGLQWGI